METEDQQFQMKYNIFMYLSFTYILSLGLCGNTKYWKAYHHGFIMLPLHSLLNNEFQSIQTLLPRRGDFFFYFAYLPSISPCYNFIYFLTKA